MIYLSSVTNDRILCVINAQCNDTNKLLCDIKCKPVGFPIKSIKKTQHIFKCLYHIFAPTKPFCVGNNKENFKPLI